MAEIPFAHSIAAHCETGNLHAMLRHRGLAISEPLLFGVGAGIFFAYLPFRRFSFLSLILRAQPGAIWRSALKRLGIRARMQRFRRKAAGRKALDELLEQGTPVALQVDLFHMDYLPDFMRVHFNAHMITVYGREGDEYLVSDCVAPSPGRIHARSLEIGRFTRGLLAPRGRIFHVIDLPESPPLAQAVRQGLRSACSRMLRIPLGPFGVRGVRKFARAIPRWPDRTDSIESLSRETLMFATIMEDLGTGGGGFRFLYATFLQEAAGILNDERLQGLSGEMRENGDRWREISLLAARMGREKDFTSTRFAEMADLVSERADTEERIFRSIDRVARG